MNTIGDMAVWLTEQKRLLRERIFREEHPYYHLCNRNPERWGKICDRWLLVVLFFLLPLAVAEEMNIPWIVAMVIYALTFVVLPFVAWAVLGIVMAVHDLSVDCVDWLRGE